MQRPYYGKLFPCDATVDFFSCVPVLRGRGVGGEGVGAGKKRRRRLLVAALLLLAAGVVVAGIVVLRLQTDRGEIVVQTDDPNLELVVQKNGGILRIRDKQTGQTWELDAQKYRLSLADQPNGLTVELPDRGTVTLRRGENKITVTTGPKGVEVPKQPAKLPNAADVLKQSDIPKDALAYIGGGDPENVPPQLVAVFSDTRFRCSERPGPMAFSPDGKQIAVANDRNEIRFLDAQTGRLLREMSSSFTPHYRMIFSPDGRHLAGTTKGGEFNVFDAETGRLAWQLKANQLPGVVTTFTFSSAGKAIYLGSKFAAANAAVQGQFTDGRLEMRDARSGEVKQSWATSPQEDFVFSPDETKMIEIIRDRKEVRLWDINKFGSEINSLGVGGATAAFSPTGKHFAVGWIKGKLEREKKEADQVVSIHDLKGDVVHTLPAAADHRLAFTPDGKTLVAVSNVGNTTVSRWDVASGKKLSSANLHGATSFIDSILSPDGKALAFRGYGSYRFQLFDTETGKSLYEPSGHDSSIASLAFSPDGKYLASSDQRSIQLWDLATARSVAKWEKTYSRPLITNLAFSPDSKLLAVAALGNGSLKLLRVPSGEQVAVFDTKLREGQGQFGSVLLALHGRTG